MSKYEQVTDFSFEFFLFCVQVGNQGSHMVIKTTNV